MQRLRAIAGEILRLFVDDARYAAALLLWILIAGLALPRLGLTGSTGGLLLFAGLVAILLESALRRARR